MQRSSSGPPRAREVKLPVGTHCTRTHDSFAANGGHCRLVKRFYDVCVRESTRQKGEFVAAALKRKLHFQIKENRQKRRPTHARACLVESSPHNFIAAKGL